MLGLWRGLAKGDRRARPSRWVPEDGVADDPSPAMALTHPRTRHACGDAQALANCQQAYDVLTVDRSAGFFISPVKKREALEVSQPVGPVPSNVGPTVALLAERAPSL